MKDSTIDKIKTVGFITGVAVAYVGICYLSFKITGKIMAKELIKLKVV